MSYRLGVDLGTTFVGAAVVRDGIRPEMIRLGSRATVIPAVAFIDDDGSIVVGEAAQQRGAVSPHSIREFKRRLGDPQPIERRGFHFSPEQLMTALFQHVLATVTATEGAAPVAITLTHPANWSEKKIALLVHTAATTTDIPLGVISEPAAAAVSYAEDERIAIGELVAVYDLGGGTFDAAVVGRTNVGFELVGRPTGIDRLGGIDFDTALLNHVNRSMDGALDDVLETDGRGGDSAGLGLLRAEVVAAKEALSNATDARIAVTIPGLETDIRITRVEFEAMIRPTLAATIESLERAVASAGVATTDLRSILLVGGSSRIPFVAQQVGAAVGRPVAVDVHPKHAVALGAALAIVPTSAQAPAAPPTPTPAPAVPAAEPTPTPAPAVPPAQPAEGPTTNRLPFIAVAIVGAILIGLGVWFVTQVLGEGTPDQTQTPTAEAVNSTLGSADSENPARSTSPAIPTTNQDDDPPQTPSLSVAPVTATCDNTTDPFVCITSLGIDNNGFLVATFDSSGFLPLVGPAPNQHVHFYFPVGSMADDELNAGSSGPDLGEWILWDEAVFAPGQGGVSYSLEDALSVGATELCALVASSSHEVTPGSGSCIPLPESAVN